MNLMPTPSLTIKPFTYIKGMEKALPDYSTRLAQRTSTPSAKVVEARCNKDAPSHRGGA